MPEQEPIPKGYTSGITLFECPGCIAEYTVCKFIVLFHDTGTILPEYVHELWRTGRMEVVYGILMHPDMVLKLENIVETGRQIGNQGADRDEIGAFFTDVVSTIGKAKNDRGYDYEPTEIETEAINSKVREMVTAYEYSLITE